MNTKRLTLAGVLTALAVVGSTLSFPVFASKCAPVQHMVNVFCAVLLGPWYGLGVAFSASLLRNLMGLGSLLAFPGSMWGALLCALIYRKTKNLPFTIAGEIFGTGILGGLSAYPIAVFFMGQAASKAAVTIYIIPFLISTVAGALLAGVLIVTLQKSGTLPLIQEPFKITERIKN